LIQKYSDSIEKWREVLKLDSENKIARDEEEKVNELKPRFFS